MVLGGVSDGVVPRRVVHADGGGEVCGVLGDRSGWWRERSLDGLSKSLEVF